MQSKFSITNSQFSLNFQFFNKYKFLVFGFLILFGICFLKLGVLVKAEIDCQNTSATGISASDADICAKQLQDLINQYLPAQNNNKKSLSALQSQLNDITKRMTALTKQLQILSQNIVQRQEDSAYTKEIFDSKARDQYMFLRLYDPITPFLFADSASKAFQEISLRQRAADADRKTIGQYAIDLIQLKKDEESLQKSKESLTASQKIVAAQTSLLAAEVAKVDAYLATLSAKQSAFIAAKLESLGLSRSAYNMKGGCSDDRNVDPGFSPRIAFFTFGVPNRVGMNQFGAKARAEAGQDYETILRAYYNFDQISVVDPNKTIVVNGTNEFGQSFDNVSMPIDEYLKHLYEMPTSWDPKALRAQAIAARSYALRVYADRLADNNSTNNFVKPSQLDQVVKKEINNGDWQAAVNDTSGKVMLQGGQPIQAWFSSTHGGYAFNSGDVWSRTTSWTKRMQDTTSGVGSFSDLFNNAYDKASPTFYCDWGSRTQYNKTAWLKPEEVADIANVLLLVQKDSSLGCFVFQSDKPPPTPDPKQGCPQTDNWNPEKVKQELTSRGGSPMTLVTDISVGVDFGTGRTTTVTVNGQTFNGDTFKSYFNQRAPSNIQIVGPLFNIEKR